MGWETVYLIIAIIVGILGIWNLARQRNAFLAIAGVLWFLVVLFELYVKSVYNLVIMSGIPEVGKLIMYVLIPAFIVFAFLSRDRR